MKPFSLDDFMAESNRIEGIERTTPEQVAATARFLSHAQVITITDLVELVKVYQPDARPRFSQGLDVRVGNHMPPRGGPHIQAALQALLDKAAPRDAPAYDIHVEYETLHPFTDGNGRSGRALWLWVMGGMGRAPLGFLHHFYYQTLQHSGSRYVNDGWISLAERRPEGDDDVLAASERRLHVKPSIVIRNAWDAGVREGDGCFYTHWRPLPAAPCISGG